MMIWHGAMGLGRQVSLLVAAAHADDRHSFYVGLACLLGTFVGNGTHSAFAKLAGEDVPVLVFLNYLSVGMLLGCTMVVLAMGEALELNWPGLLGGLLFSGSITCYVNAIKRIGIVWCDMITASAATLTSFLWGKVYFREPSTHFVGAVIGLVTLLVGIMGLSVVLFRRLEQLGGQHNERPRLPGMVLALCAGTFGGSCFAVSKLHPPDQQGVAFAWTQAFGVSVWLAALLALAMVSDGLARWSASRADGATAKPPETMVLGHFDVRRLAPLGLAQGAILAATNITTTVAAVSPVGIGVTQPVREAGHSLAVLIGVFYFREYGSPDCPFISQLSVLTTLNVAGIVVLTICGTAPV